MNRALIFNYIYLHRYMSQNIKFILYLFILQLWYLTNKNTLTVIFSLYSNWQYIILLLWHPYMKPWNLTYDSICTVFAGFWCHSFIIEISLYFIVFTHFYTSYFPLMWSKGPPFMQSSLKITYIFPINCRTF
jgi:hypothetical protein